MIKLLSIDLKADFGMLKKPDTNEPVYLTFNMLHKPAFLGILGAISGYSGFKKHGVVPEYMELLQTVKVSIAPLKLGKNNSHENGNFSKTIIKYNNSTGMASDEIGGNLIIAEQTLVYPAYRCYVFLDLSISYHKALFQKLLEYNAEYLPYLGKNEYSVWWDDAKECQFEIFEPSEKPFKINSLFIKEESLKEGLKKIWFIPGMGDLPESTYMYFENLPIGYIGAPLFQYEYKGFAYSNFELKPQYKLSKDYPLLKLEDGKIIQVY